MSHFCVMVVTESKPTKEILKAVLAPYHEFECTGDDNEYVQDVDITGQVLAEYERNKLDDDGKEQSASRFIKDWYGYDTVKEGRAMDLEGKHKHGYAVANLKGVVTAVFKRTNPNKKWDWWQVGGRFSEFLIAKPHVFEYTRDDILPLPSIGEPGLMGTKSRNDGFDIIRKGDVDFEGMRSMTRDRGLARWDRIRAVTGDLDDFIPWPRVRDEIFPGRIDKAREFYHDQRAKKVLHEKAFEKKEGGKVDRELAWVDLEDYMCSREEYGQKCENSAVTTFAVLKDGQWYQRGEMGWWAMVSDEMDKDVWDEEFRKMLDAIPDDHWLTIVDCHI